ncbi:MAG: hypothetical protein ACLSCV_06350 [Acutalibacteraceae bacterium]
MWGCIIIWKYVVKRLLQLVLILFGITLLSFAQCRRHPEIPLMPSNSKWELLCQKKRKQRYDMKWG